jgi:hypothetical protein
MAKIDQGDEGFIAGVKQGRMEQQLDDLGGRLDKVAEETKSGFETVNFTLVEIRERLVRGDSAIQTIEILGGRLTEVEKICLACRAEKVVMAQSRSEAKNVLEGRAANDDGEYVISKKLVGVLVTIASLLSGGVAWVLGHLDGSNSPNPLK